MINNFQSGIANNSISCFLGRITELDENFEKTGIMWVDFNDLDGSKKGPAKDESGTTIKKVIASWTIRAAYAAWINPPRINYKGKLDLNGDFKIDEMEFECKEANIKGTGKIKLSNATLSQVNIAGGPPLQGPCTTPVGPGTCTIPVAISSASGTATLEASGPMGEIDFNTSDATIKFKSAVTFKVNDNKAHTVMHTGNSGEAEYKISLKQDKCSVMPWCTDVTATQDENQSPDDGDSVDSYDDDGQKNVRERENFINVGDNGDKALCMAFGNSMNNLYCVDIFT